MKSPAYSHKSIERNQLQKPKKAVNMATPLHHRPHRLLLSTETSTPPTNGSRTRSGSNISYSEANFDTNMVIILAALLCALICALGLNLIVRWALRCSRRFAFESAEEAAARLAATGLKKSALRQISVVIYGATGGMNMIATDCAICLGEFVDGDKVRVLPRCNHGFHVRCIDTWLGSHSSCPTCRHSLLDQPFPPPPPPSSSSDSADADAVIVRSDHGHDHLPMPADEVG